VTAEGFYAPSLSEVRDRAEIVPVEMGIRQRSHPIYDAAGEIQAFYICALHSKSSILTNMTKEQINVLL
jgi:hypothetical protein